MPEAPAKAQGIPARRMPFCWECKKVYYLNLPAGIKCKKLIVNCPKGHPLELTDEVQV